MYRILYFYNMVAMLLLFGHKNWKLSVPLCQDKNLILFGLANTISYQTGHNSSYRRAIYCSLFALDKCYSEWNNTCNCACTKMQIDKRGLRPRVHLSHLAPPPSPQLPHINNMITATCYVFSSKTGITQLFIK
jgi:hypothetical protein